MAGRRSPAVERRDATVDRPDAAGRHRRSWVRRRRTALLVFAMLALVAGVYLISSGRRWPAAAPAARATFIRPPQPRTTPDPSPTRGSPARFVFPVDGRVSYGRDHHDYPATDILAPCGSPVVAVTDGMVLDTTTLDVYNPDINAGPTRGGLSVSILGDDGVRYYGSHLSRVDARIRPGVRVTAGQRLGAVGETGDASACHLHFGISPPCARVGDWWLQRGVVWPWPYLDSWRAHGLASPVAEVTAWQSRHGCPSRPLVDP